MKYLAVIAALTLCHTAAAGCAYPEQVSNLPDGKSASKDEMIAAQKDVKAYVASMNEYLSCLDGEVDAMGEAATDEHRIIRDKRHNAAVEAMELVAANFNHAVREYKESGN